MTNTIPNVPRELLAELQEHIDCHRDAVLWGRVCDLLSTTSPTDHVEDVRAIVDAPSPAGVDGLEVVGTLRYFMDYPDSPHSAPGYITHQFNPASWDHAGEAAGEHKLCRLSDAQAIIDGLRGEVAELVKHSEVVAQWHADAMFAIRDLKDANAVRIDELERLLTRAQIWIVDETGPGWELSESIDAALSAGKVGE